MCTVKIELAAAALALALCCAGARADEITGNVLRVHDGDTMTIQSAAGRTVVRLFDIDAPELRQPHGDRARAALVLLCPIGSEASVRGKTRDRYGRLVGAVSCAGRDTSSELVRAGDAWVFRRYAPKNSPLYPIEEEAKAARRGLWSDADPIPPWVWRRSASK